jgi:hypothetical protein
MEIFLPAPQVAVLTGIDANRVMTRVVSVVEALRNPMEQGLQSGLSFFQRDSRLQPAKQDDSPAAIAR